jgi:mRNA interferase MazF
MAKALRPQRAEIWTVQFDPSVGAEMRKLRPAVVANLDSIGRLPLRIIVPLTDWQPSFAQLPWFVHILASAETGLIKDSDADTFQVKSVSESRFVRHIGKVSVDQMDAIASAVALCIGAP